METLTPTQKKVGISKLGKSNYLVRRKFYPANCVGRFYGKCFSNLMVTL